MGAVLITGSSGAGKSSIAAALAHRGLTSIDADEDPKLCRWVDAGGRPVLDCPAEPDLVWLDVHLWAWDHHRLDELIEAAGPETLFVCGNAGNELDLQDRFERVILLVVDEPTMLARLDDPRRDNDFGRVGETRQFLRAGLPGYQKRMLALGAVPIDATRPLDQVADAILAAQPPGDC